MRFFNFQALDPKFVSALETRVLKLEGSTFGIRPSIYALKGWYKESPPPQKKKVSMTVICGAKVSPPFPAKLLF